MKKLCIIIIGVLVPLLGFTQVKIRDGSGTEKEPLKGTVKVTTTPELLKITSMWAEDFEAQYDRLTVKLNVVEGMGNEKLLPDNTDIRILYDDKYTDVYQENVTPIILGREITVAVVNRKNPFIEEILQTGVSNKNIGELLKKPGVLTWGSLLGTNDEKAINLIIPDDQMVKARLKDFTGMDGKLSGMGLDQDKNIKETVKGDPYALAFCKMADILDESGTKFDENISLLPIDRNGNNKIDSHEIIYENYESFTRGVWIGKYPKELYREIYSLSEKNQTKAPVVAFLEWIVNNGQESLIALGYDDLVYNEKRSNLNALYISEAETSEPRSLFAGQKVFALILGLFIITGLLGNFVVRLFVYRKSKAPEASLSAIPVFDIGTVNFKKGYHFDKNHTWAFMDEEGGVKIGIDDFLQHVTGPITRIKMKMPGERISKGDKVFSIIQRGKRLNIYSPVSGVIKKYNEALDNESNLVNSSPYSEGWVYVVEPTNWLAEIQGLFMGQKYLNWIKDEFLRLKDFLSSSLNMKNYERTGLVFQEGGELRDGILDECGPEIWEEFQTKFIDKKE